MGVVAGAVMQPLDVLLILTLGVDKMKVLDAMTNCGLPHTCSAYHVDTFGIIGFDLLTQQNIEMMEKNIGKKFDPKVAGGEGGQGVVVVAFSGGDVQASHDSFSPGANSTMVIADSSGTWDTIAPNCPTLYYGGVAKAVNKFTRRTEGSDPPTELVSVPQICLGMLGKTTGPQGFGVFQGDPSDAAETWPANCQ